MSSGHPLSTFNLQICFLLKTLLSFSTVIMYRERDFFQALRQFLISLTITFYFDDGLSLRNLSMNDQSDLFLSFGCFLLIMYEWNRSDIFFPLGFWPIMIYSRLEGGCECVQRRCHESRIPGRQNENYIWSHVIKMCFHVIFSCLR